MRTLLCAKLWRVQKSGALTCRCPIEKSQFLPDRKVTFWGRKGSERHGTIAPGLARAAVSRAEAGLPSARSAALEAVACAKHTQSAVQSACSGQVIAAVKAARGARPFDGSPGASRLFGGRCRAT